MSNEVRYPRLAYCVSWIADDTGVPGDSIIREPIELVVQARAELAAAERCAADLGAARKRIAELEALPLGGLIDAWALMNLDAQGEIRDINASLGRNLDILVAKLTGLERDKP